MESSLRAPRKATLSSAACYGSLVLNVDGTYSYTLANGDPKVESLAAGATAEDVFTYEATDPSGAHSTARLVVTITGKNDLPVLQDNAANATASLPGTGNVFGNDSDGQSDARILASARQSLPLLLSGWESDLRCEDDERPVWRPIPDSF